MKKLISFMKSPWVTRIYLAILLIGITLFFYKQSDMLLSTLNNSRPQILVFIFFPYLIVVGFINPILHASAYREIGHAVTPWQAFRIFTLSRIGNYLPGSIWYATNYYIFSRKLGIRAEKIGKNFIVLNALLIFTGSICSLPIISSLSPLVQKMLMTLPILMVVIVHPKILNKLFNLVNKNIDGKHFSFYFLCKVFLLYLLAFSLFGFSLFISTWAFYSVPMSTFPTFIAAASSSIVVGLLAFFAPVGIGVSEGISAAVLSRVMPIEISIMVVIAVRISSIIIDFLCALVAIVSIAKEEKNFSYRLSR